MYIILCWSWPQLSTVSAQSMPRPTTVLLLLFSLLSSRSRAQPEYGGEELDELDIYSGSGSAKYEPSTPSNTTGPVPFNQRHTTLNYLSVFPCSASDLREARRHKGDALRLLQTCDVFTFVASELATQHVNEHRQGVFSYPNSPSLSNNTYALNQFAIKGTKVNGML